MYDGIWEKAHDPAFVKNASLDDVKAALKAGGLTDAHVPIPFTVTAVHDQRQDSCCSTRAPARRLPRPPATSPRTISGRPPASTRRRSTNIVVTHFHRDHITGLMAKDTNAPVFPKAQIHVPANEYKFWTNPSDDGGRCQAHPGCVPGLEEHPPVRG